MATELFTNNTSTTVSSGGTTAPASGTTETWTVASSASFPAVTTGAGTQFHVADPALPAEKILVTNISGTTWSVTRGTESTTPVAHAAGFTVNQVVTAGWYSSAAVTSAANTFTATNDFTGVTTMEAALFTKPQPGSSVTPRVMSGRNGGFVDGIDGAAAIPSRDYALGRIEQVSTGDNTDLFYIQHNAQTTTLSGAVSAGATSLPLTGALSFTADDGTGKYWVTIGDNTAGNIQEAVQITAGRGTTTMTCVALANPHPSGARVTLGYDYANQATFEFYRVGSAASSNKNWRVTIRPDVSTFQPALGALKLEIPPSGGTTGDYFEVASRDENQKAFLIQNDYSVSVESATNDWADTNTSTTNTSAVVTFGTLIPNTYMYGCFLTGAGIPRGSYITAINAGAKQVTLSAAATATATGVTIDIHKPEFLVRQNSGGSYQPNLTVLSNATILRGRVMAGSASTVGVPPGVDFTVGGSNFYMNGGGNFPDFNLVLITGTNNAQLQMWGTAALTLGNASSLPQLGFFSVTTPVSQPNTTGTTTGFTAGTGTTVVSGSTFTGNTGSTAYTIGDIVNALKRLGLMAS